jgi:3-oxoadipate enol-lactonase
MRVHHRVDGAGPPLLLLNSLGTALALWDAQLPALAARFRVVRFDHRGHGGTAAPRGPYTVAELGEDALELLDRLGLERVSVCGLSLGGAVAMWLGAHAPDRVDRLVVACAGTRFGTPDDWRDRAATVRAHGTEAVVDGVLGRWFTAGFAAKHPDVVARFREAFCAVNREGYAGCCDALAEWDFAGEVGRIRAATLVVSASEDVVAPPAQGQAVASAVPGARFVMLEGAAHLAAAEQPVQFAAAVAEHLDRREAGR